MLVYCTLGAFSGEILQGKINSGRALQERVAEAGYDGIEIGLTVLNYPQGTRLLEGLDYKKVTFHSDFHEFSLGSANAYRRRGAIEQLRDEIVLSAEKGVRVLTFHPGYEGKKLSREQSHANVIACLDEVMKTHGELLQNGTLTLSLENMSNNPEKLCRTEDELERVFEAHPSLGMTCDLAHCALNQFDIGRFLDRIGRWIRHVHVSGYSPGRGHSDVSLAESEVDMRPFIRRLAGEDMVFCIENRDRKLTDESRKVLESVRDSLTCSA